VRPYVFLAIGVIWLIGAIFFVYNASFGITWIGKHDPALARRLIVVALYVLFLGWIVPTLFGAWLLWKK